MIDLNLDLLSVGVTAAGIGILGFMILFNDPRSITNRTFLAFSLITILWSVANYFQYQPSPPSLGLWIVRSIVFLGCWHAFTFFQLCYVFPNASAPFSRTYRFVLVPIVALTSLLTLTPLVFEQVTATNAAGVVTQIQNGPGIALFGMLVLALICGGIFELVRKTMRNSGVERRQIALMSAGTFITFVCIVTFNLVLPAAFDNARFLPLSALFIFPFIACTAFAIIQYHLLNVKVFATQAVAFFLAVATLLEVVFSATAIQLLFRMSVFALVLAFSILLVRSVLREVRQREEIERLSNEKSEFMTFASHEIRNPITAMRGYASLIADGTAGEVSAQVKDISQKILVEGNEVLALISQFLSKSKMELGQISYNNAPFDLGNAVSAIADGYKPHAEQKGLALVKHVSEEKLLVNADEGKVKEVIGNLIDNSLKYTKAGSVTVSAERHGVAIRVTVADTGVGIPPETLPQLFKKFSRADAARANLLGTGVGLYLAKTFIENMGGRIWAESDGAGKGSRFIIEFPAAR